MFNVLPEIFKKEIKTEYYLRQSIVACVFIIFLQISFLIFVFPSWLSSFYRQKEASAEIESQKSGIVSKNTDNILQTVNQTNQNLDTIDSAFDYSTVLPIVKNIISDKTSAISLSEFTYDNSAATTTIPMSVSGIAKTREDLVAFVKKLQDSAEFSDVVSPISDLAKDKDIVFTVNLNVTQNSSQNND
jgi:hypothetical protein